MKGSRPILRTMTTLVALPIVMTLAWVPSLRVGFSVCIGFFVSIGVYEYYAIVRAREISPESVGGIFAGTLVALSGCFGSLAVTNLALYGGCLLVFALHIVRGRHSIAGLAGSAFGVFYVGWFAAHIILLHSVPDVGAGLVTVLFAAVTVTDTGAYAIGSLFGKHKMAPKVSPRKTWEGSIGGLALAVAGTGALCVARDRLGLRGLPAWSYAQYLYAGAILSFVAQIGDLAESCLKRDAGVKDSGIMFPGHGGVLDRCDGLLLAAPALYYIVIPLFT